MYSDYSKSEDIKTIEGSSRQDCLDKMRDLHGPETDFQIISSRRKLKPGFLGFFQRDVVELSYILKLPPARPSAAGNVPYGRGDSMQNRMSSTGGYPAMAAALSARDNRGIDTGFIDSRDDILKNQSSSVTNALQIAQIAKQMEDFRNKMTDQMNAVVQATTTEGEHGSISKIRDVLEDNGFSKTYRNNICKRMKSEFSIDELNDFDYVQQKVVEWIAESIPVAKPEVNVPPRVVILVGPTGVGKTTTLAKMGASIAVDFKKHKENYKFPPRIRMITTDTMRVAAAEQLKRWAELISVQVDKAENSEEIKTLYESYASNSDYIFVDTSGYSPNDYENIAKMHTLLDVKNIHESVYLTVSAGVSVEDFENIIRNFEAFNFKSVIITKCDETKSFGRVISVLSERKKNVSWITTGQEVMNTIQRADPMWFVNRLVGLKFDQKDVDKRLGLSDKEESGFCI